MKWLVPALALALGAALAVADGTGTTTQPDKPVEEKKPSGNPNKAEPGLAEQGWKSYDANYVPVKDWTIKTYAGGYAGVTKKGDNQVLPLPVKDHDGVAVKAEEFAIEVDGNHDGKMDERVKTDGATSLVTLVYADGTVAPYNVRFQKGRGTWSWQRSGYWQASINKVPVSVIDNNNNGRYDENAEDAIIVGASTFATPLSDVVNIGGTLYRIKIVETGKTVWVKEYEGETGKLDARSGHKSLGGLGSAVFQKGQTWIDVASAKDKAVVVPVGKYDFFGGEVHAVSGGQAAMMRKGNMASVEVKKDETTKLAWGMALKIDFDFTVANKKVEVTVASCHVYGTNLGEEYYNFVPPAFTPVVTVWNSQTGEKAGTGSMSLC